MMNLFVVITLGAALWAISCQNVNARPANLAFHTARSLNGARPLPTDNVGAVPTLRPPRALTAIQASPLDALSYSTIIESSSAIVSSTLLSKLDIVGVSPEPIHTAFTVATFLPQPFWLLIILLPSANLTKRIMGGLGMYDV